MKIPLLRKLTMESRKQLGTGYPNWQNARLNLGMSSDPCGRKQEGSKKYFEAAWLGGLLMGKQKVNYSLSVI